MSASAAPNDIVSYPAPKPMSEFVSVPAPPKPVATQVAASPVTLTYKIASDDAELLLQGARAQIWTADILIVAVAVYSLRRFCDLITAPSHRRCP